MFSYSYDPETGGLLLNDGTPNFSKEPRPVYAAEMLLLHMDERWYFDIQDDAPYLWAEATSYYYRGVLVAKAKGGSLCEPPEVEYQSVQDEKGRLFPALPYGTRLCPVNLDAMVRKNAALMTAIEQIAMKRIYSYYQRYQKKMDCFHVAFSGGKDSVVLLELVKKTLPKDAFKVVFGDTGMELPDTYHLVDVVEEQCSREGISFYRVASHFDPHESWRIFGPPSRTLRWCCTVHKATPQTLKLREILNRNDYKGADFVGVRASESLRRRAYEYENYGKKQKGQYSFYPILDWDSSEIWMYIFSRSLTINRAYKFGSTRVGCLFCPMGGGRSDYFRHQIYTAEIDRFTDIIRETANDKNIETYILNGGWADRRSGQIIRNNVIRYRDTEGNGKLNIFVHNPLSDWKEWIKTIDDIPIDYQVEPTQDGYKVTVPYSIKTANAEKYFKNVFRKAAYCVGCGACEANCPYGCISFKNGLHIENCRHCRKCHEIPYGCLLYDSLKVPLSGGKKMNTICTFAGHAPKQEWIQSFFENGNEFFLSNNLGPNQARYFKVFLADSELAIKEKTTPFYTQVSQLGSMSETAWGLIYTKLAYNNAQIRWYIDNMQMGVSYARAAIIDALLSAQLSKADAGFVAGAFKRLCETQLGTVLHFGTTASEGRKLASLTRTPCSVHDSRVILYALYRYAEECGGYYEFTLSRLMDMTRESKGISPVKLFGLTEDKLSAVLAGLSAKYPEFINASFTHGLNRIVLNGPEKKSKDVLKLFP